MFKLKNHLTLIILFFYTSAFAEIVTDFKVVGNDRVSKNTIINFTEIDKGDDVSSRELNNSLKKIYETNFFENVKFSLENNILIINVKEYPIIQEIEFRGIKRKKTIESIAEQLTLKAKSPFNTFLLEKDMNQIINLFRQTGYYFTEVDVIEQKNSNNTIKIIYDINRGEQALIKDISFLGNKIFKDRKLHSIITSEEARFWKFISKGKYINIERINLDKRLLENFYKRKGYYQVEIKEAYSQIKNKKDFSLIYNIDAGNKFYFGNFSYKLPSDFDQNSFSKIDKIFNKLNGTKYNIKEIEKVLNEIEIIALKENYEFIDANINETIVGDKINFIFDVKETENFYVNKIDITGNNITEEFFIRNQLIVDEGDPFNNLLFNKSINNLKSTGIFKTVKPDVSDVDGENKKNIKIAVTEQATGEISAGAGVGTNGSNISFAIKENNFAGRGIQLESNITISDDSIKGLLAYTEPNFRYSDRALSTSIQSTVTDKEAKSGYKSSLNKVSLGTSYEQFTDLFFSPSLSIASESLTTTSDASANYKKQEGSYMDALFRYGIVYDKRNSRFQPTSGYVSSWVQHLPIVSDDSAILNGYMLSGYKEVIDNMVVSMGLYTRAINSLSDEDVRVSKRLYAPSRRLRGFQQGKVGPKDSGDYVGGNYVTTINTSSTVPYILNTFENTDLKLFLDIGNVWGVDYSSSVDDSNKIRSSAGVALEIFSPVGPLTFTLANSITKASTDQTESFNFQLGTTF